MKNQNGGRGSYLSNSLIAGVVGTAVGFLLCWFTVVRPMSNQADRREQSLREWEQINRQERAAIADIKTIGIEELRKWVSTLDEQNTRYAELQSVLHKQQLSLLGPATTHLWISLIAVLGMAGLAMWMMRDSNADAARTLHGAVAVLPSLREALRAKDTFLEGSVPDRTQLDSAALSPALAATRLIGKVKRFNAERAFGFIAFGEDDDEIFFHNKSVRLSDVDEIREGIDVSFRQGNDRNGRPCAEDVEIVR